ncbi:hypothetical protein DDZ13_12740 [Coraliomargarita sinensis]|uniref:Uncharacterized protein n=1 Tax=Coraliomargarita sinensis TaxID=2174842 RepID=A0A317ZDJ2_9BACT|nr:hypothetical protein DDZ13_12740 [Coraliomargarita sinensis]
MDDLSFFKSFLKRFLKTTLSIIDKVFKHTAYLVHTGVTRQIGGRFIDRFKRLCIRQMAHKL